ncbi:hypothetical protein ACFXPX_13825 [Kitasatospora sp. NPDC059146]|uniref:hypothetical protein n=1 Tax=Kitasatospora sp. NPDC059146 TaxID=3346741 RepID=UPI00368B9BC7
MHDPRPEEGRTECSGTAGAAGPQEQADRWQQAEQAERAVRAVVAWYSSGIRDLRRAVREGAGTADLDVLLDARQQAMADLQRLEDGVDADEAARLAAHYTAALRELTAGN